MKKQMWVGISLALMLLGCSETALGNGCTGKEREASLPSNGRIFGDAVTLSESLRKNGVLVDCITRSKMEGTFEGQNGAATYRSNYGRFEALFLAQPETFEHLKVIEQRDGERFSYRFAGPPQPWAANLINSAYRIYFIKNGNILFVVDSNAELAAILEKFSHFSLGVVR